ncbi:MAG: RluA family pseudouridine synthase [Candidatus Cloacimonadaceae bacterium]|jgi:tRNA pseudouridine32 synthase/23S rRNA pseudouridine746 synthase|nr:RluA family pseudouridine synthase [Candidatus Cloacimonadaceae bacterium]
MMEKIQFQKPVMPGDPKTVCDFLAHYTELSKQKIKDAMKKGAVFLARPQGGRQRVRRATQAVSPGFEVLLFYDPAILNLTAPPAECMGDFHQYSVWYKPGGLLSQGSQWGDHCACLRQAELFFSPRRKAFLIHRLDREASGLMVIAHTREVAARLSALFQQRQVIKQYIIEVFGLPGQKDRIGKISLALDGKPALTNYRVREYDLARNTALVTVTIETGRTHQIRRHFDSIGCPVVGDPVYGRGNHGDGGLRLCAYGLSFTCPVSGRLMRFALESRYFHWPVAPALLAD